MVDLGGRCFLYVRYPCNRQEEEEDEVEGEGEDGSQVGGQVQPRTLGPLSIFVYYTRSITTLHIRRYTSMGDVRLWVGPISYSLHVGPQRPQKCWLCCLCETPT